MAEQIINGYARLFELRVLHHFYLDDGNTVFNVATHPERLLKAYDVRTFFHIQPTASTAQRLAGLRCVFVNTALGFVVAASKNNILPADLLLEFAITVVDPAFFNYTALTLLPRDFIDIVDNGAATRYKRNVFVFSNQTGHLFSNRLLLSSPVPVLDTNQLYDRESIVKAGNYFIQALGDQTNMSQTSDVQVLGVAASQYLSYVHQDDIPALPTAAAPARGIAMNDEIPKDVFAFIRISAQGNPTTFNLLDSGGLPLDTAYPVFYLHFKNRMSYWRYLHQKDGTIKTLETVPIPLTYAGNGSASNLRKPSFGQVKALPLNNITGAPLRLISEIFE